MQLAEWDALVAGQIVWAMPTYVYSPQQKRLVVRSATIESKKRKKIAILEGLPYREYRVHSRDQLFTSREEAIQAWLDECRRERDRGVEYLTKMQLEYVEAAQAAEQLRREN